MPQRYITSTADSYHIQKQSIVTIISSGSPPSYFNTESGGGEADQHKIPIHSGYY